MALQQGVSLDPPVGDRDHVRGPEEAPVTLVEYGNYECPYCGRAYPMVNEIRERLGDRLRFVFRNFPLDSIHPHARRAAEAAETADAQGKFWQMHDLLYENQQDLEEEDLKRYAAELGLDVASFEENLTNHRYAPRVEEDRLGGEKSGVKGTPTFFINGTRYRGSLDLETLLTALEEAATGGPDAVPGERERTPEASPFADPLEEICSERRDVNTRTLKSVVELAVEIAREGREGRKIGTLFVVGDSDAVLRNSRPLILDPLAGHPDENKRIDDPDVRETLKELAQLDGAFVVSNEGVVLSAARYIDAVSDALDLPLGLGGRHVAAASISSRTNAVAVVVSESSVVRMFDDGQLVSEILPELWMLDQYGSYLDGSVRWRTRDGMEVRSRDG